ncbi:hypothetical protein AB0J01_38020 [Streptomyces sp. NPDC050204]|uniref:hypothetical protein n=1 Tax=Streptomyces sp. NPDC050204 TaxID=3155514 RepID=UPI00342501CF
MLAGLIRRILVRLAVPLESGSYACGKCGLSVKVTDYPGRVARVLDMAIAHTCKPGPKTL